MSESERTRRYYPRQVLISVTDILDCPYPSDSVFLTGAQMTLLRNLTQYLHRCATFVSEYRQTSYLVPTGEEWDALEAIVAGMERVLMGTGNVIFGYHERWSEGVIGTSTGGAATNAVTDVVPAGYIYVLKHWTIVQLDDGPRSVFLALTGGEGEPYLFQSGALAAVDYEYAPCDIPLKEGDALQFTVWGLADTKTCILTAWGYKMKVPE